MEQLLEACASGNLNKLKSIYNDLVSNSNSDASSSIKQLNIREQNDILFKTACRFNYPMIAKWLVSLCNDYEIIDIHKRTGIIFGIKRHNPFNKYPLIKGDCAICLEENVNTCIKTECSHIFCKSCITEWFRNHNECPMCRNKIEFNIN